MPDSTTVHIHHETWMIDFSLSIHYVQVYTIVGMARQNKSPSVE